MCFVNFFDFDKKYLELPKEVIISTLQNHQRYFPIFDKKDEITNFFLVVINKKDKPAEENTKINFLPNIDLSLNGFSIKRQLNQAITKEARHKTISRRSGTSPESLCLAKANRG